MSTKAERTDGVPIIDVPSPRAPIDSSRARVAGVGGGVGTTTVAGVLDAVDAGVFTGRRVDVLVCHDTGESLIRAGHAAALLAADGHRPPVVAVTATSAGPGRLLAARLRLLEPHTRGVVVLPFVRRWREIPRPITEARQLARHHDPPHRSLRRYAAAATELRRAVHAVTGLCPPRPTHAAPRPRPVSPVPGRNLSR